MGKQELVVYGKESKERKTYLTDSAKYYLKRYLSSRCQDGKTIENLQEEPLFVTLHMPHNRLTVAGVQYMLRELGNVLGFREYTRIGYQLAQQVNDIVDNQGFRSFLPRRKP